MTHKYTHPMAPWCPPIEGEEEARNEQEAPKPSDEEAPRIHNPIGRLAQRLAKK